MLDIQPENALYKLATRPFQDGHADLATLANFVDRCIANPPLAPLPDNETYFEVLPENVDWSQQSSAAFYSYVTFIAFLVAELWAKNHSIALFAAGSLWDIATHDAISADQTRLLLAALTRHPAYASDPETHALVAGLRGLFDLHDSERTLTPEILEVLDAGIAFPRSGFVKHELQGLLWSREGTGELAPPLTWNALIAYADSRQTELRSRLLDIYPRAFFALRYWRMADDALEQLQMVEAVCEDSREIAEAPGAEYLSKNQMDTLRANSVRAFETLIGALQSCLHLLNRAENLLHQSDPWTLTYMIRFTAARVRLRGFTWTHDEDLLKSARGHALRAAWATRHQVPFLYDNARNELAKIYSSGNQPESAKMLWGFMLRRIAKHSSDNVASSVAASANAALGELSLRSGDVQAAKAYCLAAIDSARSELVRGTSGDHFNLDDWTGNLLDNAIAACIATGDAGAAVEIFERWYRAAPLTRHLHLAPLTEMSLRANLPEDTAAVYLSTAKLGLSVVVVTKARTTGFLLEQFDWSTLKGTLGPWLKATWRIRTATPTQVLESLNMFGQALERTLAQLTPIVQTLADCLSDNDVGRVVLIPGRELGSLPLHAVPLGPGIDRGARFGDLVDILYAPNATIWLWGVQAQSERRAQNRFEAFATGESGFSAELQQAAALWESASSPHINASAPEFLKLAAESAILHVSCHGWFWVVYGDANRLDVDAGLDLGGGRLTWRNLLDDLRLPQARLVVLSACESLLLSHRDILNQQFGLPYAFLAAGAPLLLGTSWRVEATATALLITRFHENLRRRAHAASRALAEAQCWLRGLTRAEVGESVTHYFGGKADGYWIPAGNHPYAHPYWWAGFRLIGADLTDAQGESIEGR